MPSLPQRAERSTTSIQGDAGRFPSFEDVRTRGILVASQQPVFDKVESDKSGSSSGSSTKSTSSSRSVRFGGVQVRDYVVNMAEYRRTVLDIESDDEDEWNWATEV
mmetsp:Transcript_35567/g.81516  ORF Transcript_35567/g.81516 Transcript_35567/m.81516 type:complete len:106 (-) Transcript_35567:104-421(-)